MEEKYYIPEVEEFHVGFEYETKEDNKEWIKRTVTTLTSLGTLDNFIHRHKEDFDFRVKKLDQQDIEECGWRFYKEMEKTYLNEPCLMFFNDELNLMLGFHYQSSRISLATQDPSKNEIFSKTNQDPNKTSMLKVKNKSEFKKLVKMLDFNKLTREHVKKVVDYVFGDKSEKVKERKVTLYRVCAEKGWVNLNEPFHCGNENCTNCNQMEKIIIEEFQKQVDGIK